MTIRQATPAEIRECLDHGRGYRKVRVSKDGRVRYWGSPNATDRSHDWWHEGGQVEDYRREDLPDGSIIIGQF